MNVVELIALLETVKDQSLEVYVADDEGYYQALPVDPVLTILGDTVYIEEGQ